LVVEIAVLASRQHVAWCCWRYVIHVDNICAGTAQRRGFWMSFRQSDFSHAHL
jgi:hypothetical protein